MTRGEEDPRSSHPGSTPEPGVPPWVRCRFGYLCRVSVQDTWTPHCALSRSGPSRPCRRSSAMVHTPVVQHFQGRSYKDGNGVVSMSKGARASVSLCFSFPTPPTQPPHTPTAGPRHHERRGASSVGHHWGPKKNLPDRFSVIVFSCFAFLSRARRPHHGRVLGLALSAAWVQKRRSTSDSACGHGASDPSRR